MFHVFFDLDGTLTDSAEGITRSLAHALHELSGPAFSPEELSSHIGTGLDEIFADLLSTDDPSTIARAVDLYLDRFRRFGIRENRLYPGVEAALTALRGRGHALYVATAKTQSAAEEVIEIFGLQTHFRAVHGARCVGKGNKGEMLARVLLEAELDPAACIMVGDRHHDVTAARQNGMRSVWADWGYGGASERDGSRPDHVASDFEQLVGMLARKRDPRARC